MTERLQVFKCEVCGNIVEVLHAGIGELVCCGQPMVLFKENTTDAAVEKHVPVSERTECCAKVQVGSVPHPMQPEHYIEWIELIVGDAVQRRFLKPGESPEAVFPGKTEGATTREYCNLHGLWKGEVK